MRFLPSVRPHLLRVSACPIRLELVFERLHGASEIGQLAGDPGDVLLSVTVADSTPFVRLETKPPRRCRTSADLRAVDDG